MTHPHDMGGRTGDGPVIPEPDGFAQTHHEWERSALALTLAAGALGRWSIDRSRAAREHLPDYARLSYYEKWLAALADLCVDKGLVSREELAAAAKGAVPAAVPLASQALTAARVAPVLAKGSPYARPGQGPAPRFAPGDLVRTRTNPDTTLTPAPGGLRHSRLPAYAAGRTGRVVLAHGPHVFADTSAAGLGEAPEPLYTVAFRAADLWPDAEGPADEVTIDIWQSVLSPA